MNTEEDQINLSSAQVSGNVTSSERDSAQPGQEPAKLNPMSPLAASATVINLILATGPFTYPYGYTSLGPVISAPLLFMTAILAYITAIYLVEALSIASATAATDE